MPNSNVMVDQKFSDRPAAQRHPLGYSPSIAKKDGLSSPRPSEQPWRAWSSSWGCHALTTTCGLPDILEPGTCTMRRQSGLRCHASRLTHEASSAHVPTPNPQPDLGIAQSIGKQVDGCHLRRGGASHVAFGTRKGTIVCRSWWVPEL